MNLISPPYLKRHCLKFLNATYRVLRILVCTRTGRKIKEILPGQGESTNILLASLSKILSGYSDSMIGDRTVFLKVFLRKVIGRERKSASRSDMLLDLLTDLSVLLN